MHLPRLLALSPLWIAALSAPTLSPNPVVHERRDRLPTGWVQRGRVHEDSVVQMRIGLTQNNLHRAEEFITDVSHPDSPNYGKHWTAREVAAMFAPSNETVWSIYAWLARYGIASGRIKQSQSLNWLLVNVTASEAETLLNTTYYQYTHAESGQAHVGCEAYSVPEDVQRHVDFITPTLHFDARIEIENPNKRRSMVANDIAVAEGQTAAAGDDSPRRHGGRIRSQDLDDDDELSHCDTSTTPNCLRALYQFPENVPAHPHNSYGVLAFTPQAYLAADLDLFFERFAPHAVGQRPFLESIDGGYLQTEAQGFDYNSESALSLQYAMSLVYPQKVTLYQVGDSSQRATFNNFLDALDGSYCAYEGGDDPFIDAVYPSPSVGPGVYKGPQICGGFVATKVISITYGAEEIALGPFYTTRQCHEFMKLALQGVTVLTASGDHGVAGRSGRCIDDEARNFNQGTSGRFNPYFPTSCPYVTSVGATQLPRGANTTQPEQAAERLIYRDSMLSRRGFSGGGFSNVFPRPAYQSSAVAAYLAQHPPPYGPERYNTSQSARGYPDVALAGSNFRTVYDDEFHLLLGTSASAPVLGSIITLINAARLRAGKSPVGFLNPTLYAHPHVLNDITRGSNPGCGTQGFTCVEGWDPVTGLGTPNYPRMLALWLSLP